MTEVLSPTESSVSTQSVESGVSESTPKVAEPVEKPTDQSQKTESVKVDNSQQPTSSEKPVRPPSYYYRERREIKEMRDSMKALVKEVTELRQLRNQTASPEPKKEEVFNEKAFYDDPYNTLAQQMKVLEDNLLKKLEGKVPETLSKIQAQTQRERDMQEALELIFPKSEDDAQLTLQDKALKYQDIVNQVDTVMKKYGLDAHMDTKPKFAIQKAIEIMQMEQKVVTPKPTNSNVPTKGQLGGVMTGSQGAKKMENPELVVKAKEITAQLAARPELRHDEKFMADYNSVISSLEAKK